MTTLNKSSPTDFVIGPGKSEQFPVVYLEPEPFSPIEFIRYQWETCLEAFDTLRQTMETLSKSLRLFELNAYTALLLFIVLSYVALSKRIKIPLQSLKGHLEYRLRGSYFSTSSEKQIAGRVIDSASNEVLPSADVFLINPRNNTILAHVSSRQNGGFVFSVHDTHTDMCSRL